MSSIDVNSMPTVIFVTVMVAVMVLMLPWVDRKISSRLGLNLHGGLSANPDADRLLRIRRGILTFGILVYLAVFAYLVFFSRNAAEQYTVHVAPLQDLRDAFSTDHGFSDVIRRIFTEGFTEAFRNVRLVRPDDLIQFYLNIMVFVPLGYLLPYVFRWFRERVRMRPVLVCFLLSFMVENVQLMSRRGYYDLDDIIANTIGGFIGEFLYISFAYMLTHPAWKNSLQGYQAWRRQALRKTLYSFRKGISVSRTVLYTANPDAVMDFYAGHLGFRMVARLRDKDAGTQVILLQLGRCQAEFRYDPSRAVPEGQEFGFYTAKIPSVRERLRTNGITLSADFEDPCTGRRGFRLSGPDGVRITIYQEI